MPGACNILRDKIDILDLIQADLPHVEWSTEASGSRYVCNSPFREENTPSFKVDIERKRFKDYGGEGHYGDIIKWVMIWHKLTFIEAVLHLSNRFHINLDKFKSPEAIRMATQRDRYVDANRYAADIMHDWLVGHPQIREDFLTRSGFTLEQIAPYKVGYCPSRDALVHALLEKIKLTEDEIRDLEFSRQDLFGNVVVYPIHNYHNEVIGFRTKLADGNLHYGTSKYIGNKATHPLADLSVVYGFSQINRSINSTNSVTMVEGFRDAIALGAVAIMGSEVREEQVAALIRNGVDKFNICLDGDETGWSKSLKVVDQMEWYHDKYVTISRPPLDIDPHEVWRVGGKNAVDKMLADRRLPLEFWLDNTYDIDSANITDHEKIGILTAIKPKLFNHGPLQTDLILPRLAKSLELSVETLHEIVAEIHATRTELFSVDAEQAVLKYVFLDPHGLSNMLSRGVSDETFAIDHHKKCWLSTVYVYERYRDQYTPQNIIDYLVQKHPDPTITDTVAGILDITPKYAVDVATTIVLDLHKRRVALRESEVLGKRVKNLQLDFNVVVDQHRKNLTAKSKATYTQANTPEEISNLLAKSIEKRIQSGGAFMGSDFSATLPALCQAINGISPGHDVVIAGSTGAGKSLLAMNIITPLVMDKGEKWLWINQEMTTEDNGLRMVSIMTGISNRAIIKGQLNNDQVGIVHNAIERVATSGLYSYQPVHGTIDEILATIEDYHFKYKLTGVVWDYIQLVSASNDQRGMSRDQVIGEASTIMKNKVALGMQLGCIVVAQRNRSGDQHGSEAIGGSYKVAQDADVLIEIQKPRQRPTDDSAQVGNRMISIPKLRHGASDAKIDIFLSDDQATSNLRLIEAASLKERMAFYKAGNGMG